MKKNYLILILLLVAGNSNAQWLPSGATTGNIYYGNGNVGIGTTSTTVNAKVEIVSDNSMLRLRGTQFSTNTPLDILNLGLTGAGANNLTFRVGFPYAGGVNAGGRLDLIKLLNGNTIFATSETGTQLGNVGIGTTTPLSLFSLIKAQAGTNTDGLDGSMLYLNNGSTPDGSIVIKSHIAADQVIGAIKFHVSPDNSNYSQAAIKAIAGTGSVANTLAFYTSTSNTQHAGSEVMRIQNNYVGIGTANPDAMLAVKGTIHAQEVKVDLSVPGPDYVFERTYDLFSLENLKTYIAKNKHLPEIPSANQMKEAGIDLGEMNMLLLKKIEELTLYSIQQNDLVKDQQKLLGEQKAKLDQLEAAVAEIKKALK